PVIFDSITLRAAFHFRCQYSTDSFTSTLLLNSEKPMCAKRMAECFFLFVPAFYRCVPLRTPRRYSRSCFASAPQQTDGWNFVEALPEFRQRVLYRAEDEGW